MLFYDFEVFKHDWLCVIIDMTAKTETVIVNNPEELEQFYEKHKTIEFDRIYDDASYEEYEYEVISAFKTEIGKGFEYEISHAVSVFIIHFLEEINIDDGK